MKSFHFEIERGKIIQVPNFEEKFQQFEPMFAQNLKCGKFTIQEIWKV